MLMMMNRRKHDNQIKLTHFSGTREMYRDGETPFGLLNEAMWVGTNTRIPWPWSPTLPTLDKGGIDRRT